MVAQLQVADRTDRDRWRNADSSRRNNGRDRDSFDGDRAGEEKRARYRKNSRREKGWKRSAFGGGPAVDNCDKQQNVDRNYAVINLETYTRTYVRVHTSRIHTYTSAAPAGFTGGWRFLYLAVGTVRRLHVYTHRLAALYACLRWRKRI